MPLFLPRVCVSPGPRVKRPKLEAVKRLNFEEDEMEELLLPDCPPQDINPPLSPEVPAELWGKGCVAWAQVSQVIGGSHSSDKFSSLGLQACGKAW